MSFEIISIGDIGDGLVAAQWVIHGTIQLSSRNPRSMSELTVVI
jgi:hypothetical protein